MEQITSKKAEQETVNNNPGNPQPPAVNEENTATQIINSGRVTFGNAHPAPARGYLADDDANAIDNINDASNGQPAQTSPYSDVGSTNVNLQNTMLQGMQTLSETYTFTITEITGGDHSSNSRHYLGVAIDISVLNGRPVNANNPAVVEFMQAARDAGATEVLGPGSAGHANHIHIAWPRPRPQPSTQTATPSN